ncbi:MAG: hypothetical protein DLM55_07415 [Acidimicrobiales bacterium]|nr:MAG: hypothetical protein DLM55_07415 [Acidimicrobiales bacterium]
MIHEFAAQVVATHGADVLYLATDGNKIAGGVRDFIAPLAAIIIGVMGIRYLIGDQRSMAGFIGFLLLGIIVYAFIKYGKEILDSFSQLLQGWLA